MKRRSFIQGLLGLIAAPAAIASIPETVSKKFRASSSAYLSHTPGPGVENSGKYYFESRIKEGVLEFPESNPFVYCGFRPKHVMIRPTKSNDWVTFETENLDKGFKINKYIGSGETSYIALDLNERE